MWEIGLAIILSVEIELERARWCFSGLAKISVCMGGESESNCQGKLVDNSYFMIVR